MSDLTFCVQCDQVVNFNHLEWCQKTLVGTLRAQVAALTKERDEWRDSAHQITSDVLREKSRAEAAESEVSALTKELVAKKHDYDMDIEARDGLRKSAESESTRLKAELADANGAHLFVGGKRLDPKALFELAERNGKNALEAVGELTRLREREKALVELVHEIASRCDCEGLEICGGCLARRYLTLNDVVNCVKPHHYAATERERGLRVAGHELYAWMKISLDPNKYNIAERLEAWEKVAKSSPAVIEEMCECGHHENDHEGSHDMKRAYCGGGLSESCPCRSWRPVAALSAEPERKSHDSDCAVTVNARHGCTCGAEPESKAPDHFHEKRDEQRACFDGNCPRKTAKKEGA